MNLTNLLSAKLGRPGLRASAGPAEPVAQVALSFSGWQPRSHAVDALHKDLSAVARVGDSLFLACDETASVERLQRHADGSFGAHRHLPLGSFVKLPDGDGGEMDIEGLCAADGYLWIVGSHALKRCKPKGDGAREALRKMEAVEREANRYFLGRIPIVEEEPGIFMLARSAGKRRASWVKFDRHRSRLMDWLAADPHLAPFLQVPSKENGLDVEGIAVREDRVWLGLRGPVLSGYAVVLDLEFKPSSRHLKARRPEGQFRYRKHLIDTRGLGIRDMRLHGEDLLLLVGPTMSLEGPAFVLRWHDAVHENTSGVIEPGQVEIVAELPYRLHADHPEGLELWPEQGPDALLVIYDAPGPDRVDAGSSNVKADIIKPALAVAGP